MHSLYWLLTFMLAAALFILIIPFLQNRAIKFKNYFFVSVAFILFSSSLYFFSGDKKALQLWLTGGKEHYLLQEKFVELGGTDGIIERIEKKLKSNPNDAQGWFILGKLYISKQNDEAALAAFTKAHELQTADNQYTQYYELMTKKIAEKSNEK